MHTLVLYSTFPAVIFLVETISLLNRPDHGTNHAHVHLKPAPAEDRLLHVRLLTLTLHSSYLLILTLAPSNK